MAQQFQNLKIPNYTHIQKSGAPKKAEYVNDINTIFYTKSQQICKEYIINFLMVPLFWDTL